MNSLIIFGAKYLFAAVILTFAYVWLKLPGSQKKQLAATIVLAGVLALAASRISGKLYYDPRPFVTHNLRPLIPHAADNGFPSDHALLTMALTAAMYFYNRKWAAAALVLTSLVGLARVLAHIHSPIDIAGAWLISIIAVSISYILVRRRFLSAPAYQTGEREKGD